MKGNETLTQPRQSPQPSPPPSSITITPNLLNMAAIIKANNKRIFLSYAWDDGHNRQTEGVDAMVDAIEQLLVTLNIPYYRDKGDLTDQVELRKFMDNAKECIFICFVNKKYLQSDNCLYEIKQAMSGNHNKIFPIIHEAVASKKFPDDNIFVPDNRVIHIKFWQNRHKKLQDKVATLIPDSKEIEIMQQEVIESKSSTETISPFIDLITRRISITAININETVAARLVTAVFKYCTTQKAAITKLYSFDEKKSINKQVRELLSDNLKSIIGIIEDLEIKKALKQLLQIPSLDNFNIFDLSLKQKVLITDQEYYNNLTQNANQISYDQIEDSTITNIIIAIKSLNAVPIELARKIYFNLYKSLPDDYYRSIFTEQITIFAKQSNKQIIIDGINNIPQEDGSRVATDIRLHNWHVNLLQFTEEFEQKDWVIVSKKKSDGTFTHETRPPEGRIMIESINLGRRLLKPQIQAQLFSQTGEFEDNAIHGTRKVTLAILPINQRRKRIYFKLNPEFPGIQTAAIAFCELLIGEGTDNSELIKFTDANGKSFPVLASDSMGDVDLATTFKYSGIETTLNILDTISPMLFSRLFLLSLLITNEDAKPDNIILTNGNLFLIDNDRCFFPSVVLEKDMLGREVTTLQMKNFLFCMNQMNQAIDQEVREEFLSLNSQELLKKWLYRLEAVNQLYFGLFGIEKIEELYQEDKRNPVIIPIAFPTEIAEIIFAKFNNIRQLLQLDQPITHLQILTRVESKAGREYERLHNSPLYPNTFKRWQVIQKEHYQIDQQGRTQSRMVTKTLAAKSLVIRKKQDLRALMSDRAYPTSPAFAYDYLLTNLFNIGDIVEELKQGKTEKFNQLMTNKFKAEVINRIRFNQAITQTNQAIIFNLASEVEFTEIDFSNATTLTDESLVKILRNSGDNLRNIKLNNCSNITEKTLVNIAAYCLNVEEIEMSNLPNLEEIKRTTTNFIGQKTVIFPNLRRIDLSNCANLKKLYLNAVIEDISRATAY